MTSPLWVKNFPKLRCDTVIGIRIPKKFQRKIHREAEQQGLKTSVYLRRLIEQEVLR